MSLIYIATTTINKPSFALKKFALNKNYKLIVALDKKTPKFELKNAIILSTTFQENKWKKLSKLIGWNCVQRRNFAILEALEQGAKKIALIDDDNIPYSFWSENIFVGKKVRINKILSNKIVFDPIGYTNYKNLWHRGYPLELVNNRIYKKKGSEYVTPDIQANFWNGDPDIDAICRILFNPSCTFKNKYFPFFSKQISPFNSQNTILLRKVFHDYFLFPHIGRMDDIWASFYVTSKKYKVIYDRPTVIQKRNEHNLLVDFKKETIGYLNSLKLIEKLYKNSDEIYNFLPKKSSLAFDEWKKIVSNIK
jgi:hypothetical protein